MLHPPVCFVFLLMKIYGISFTTNNEKAFPRVKADARRPTTTMRDCYLDETVLLNKTHVSEQQMFSSSKSCSNLKAKSLWKIARLLGGKRMSNASKEEGDVPRLRRESRSDYEWRLDTWGELCSSSCLLQMPSFVSPSPHASRLECASWIDCTWI